MWILKSPSCICGSKSVSVHIQDNISPLKEMEDVGEVVSQRLAGSLTGSAGDVSCFRGNCHICMWGMSLYPMEPFCAKIVQNVQWYEFTTRRETCQGPSTLNCMYKRELSSKEEQRTNYRSSLGGESPPSSQIHWVSLCRIIWSKLPPLRLGLTTSNTQHINDVLSLLWFKHTYLATGAFGMWQYH